MGDENGKAKGRSQAPFTRAVDGPAGKHHKPKRFFAKMQSRIALRLLRGEDLQLLCREYAATAPQMSRL